VTAELFTRQVREWTSSDGPGSAARRVVDAEVSPGRFVCRIEDRTAAEPLHVDVGFPMLGDADISELVSRIVDDPALGARLVTGQLPAELAGRLVPPVGEWSGDCSCGEWVRVCQHQAAAVWHLNDLIEADPFALFILRGSSRADVEGSVRELRGDEDPTAERHDGGVDASQALMRTPAPLPRPAPLPWQAGSPPALPHPPIDSGLSAPALAALVDDAAARAVALLADDGGSALDLDLEEDVIRRAAASGETDSELLAQQLGWRVEAAGAALAAWRVGGRAGLRAARFYWEAPRHELDEAALAVSARRGVRARVSRNVVSGAGFQLRLDRDQRWWRFAPDDDLGWVLDSEGFDDPIDALEAPPPASADRLSPR